MRNPNGYGGISNLGGNRRNPFRVRITTGWDYDPATGKSKQRYATLGYYASRREAMMALAEYNKDPYNLDKNNITFAEAHEQWAKENYPGMGKSLLYAYKTAYDKCEKIHNKKMIDLKKQPLQDVMNSVSNYSETTQSKVKAVIRNVFRYCIENDILQKDYSAFIKTSVTNQPEGIHSAYTEAEIKILWDNIDTPVKLQYSAKDIRDIYPVDTILIMIYTGMRPGELMQMEIANIDLDQRYMVGGLKTKAGKQRSIPIHDDIVPLIKKRMDAGEKYLIPYKSDNPPTMNQYRLYIFDPVMKALNLHHLPHDGRHTFASFADRAELNPLIIKRIMGHKTNDITKDVYTHKERKELVEAVNKIIFLKK